MPRSFYPILLIEFWERFAFYGVQAVAVVMFIKKFGFSEHEANNLFSCFSALLYAFLVFGGGIGDKVLGIRRTYMVGILFLILGYAGLAVASTQIQDKQYLFLAMGVVLVGNILFKTNASNFVTKCFEPNDPRLDNAFTYFYMSINLGSMISILMVPIIVQYSPLENGIPSYQYGLAMLSFGMIAALITFFGFIKTFKKLDNDVGKNMQTSKFKIGIVVLASLAFAKILAILLQNLDISTILLYVFGSAILLLCVVRGLFMPKKERKGVLTALALMAISMFFWVMYMQSSTSMTLFASHSVDMRVFGYNIPPEMTQALNPILLIIIGPILASIYSYTYNRGSPMSIPTKFVLGIMAASLAFFVLAYSCNFHDENYKVSFSWLVLSYALYSLGELLVSAIGLSMVSRLFPTRMSGFALGMWYMVTALGQRLGGQVANIAASSNSDVGATSGLEYLAIYHKLYLYIGSFGVALGLFCVLFIGKLKRNITEVETKDMRDDEKNMVVDHL